MLPYFWTLWPCVSMHRVAGIRINAGLALGRAPESGMTVKSSSPPGLPAGIARPLIEAAQSVATIAPWEFMSDLELIGLRDEAGDELHVASVLGRLGTLFGIVIYRHDTGLRWIHSVVASRSAPAPLSGLEEMDCL